MIDLDRIVAFECQVERCIWHTREINMLAETRMHSRPKDALQLDHIVPQVEGGSDRVENLRLAHYVCNVSRAFYQGERKRSSSEKSAATRRAQNVPIACDKCGTEYKGAPGLRAHVRQAGCGGTVPIVDCPRCGHVFKSQYQKDRHTPRACRTRQRAKDLQVDGVDKNDAPELV